MRIPIDPLNLAGIGCVIVSAFLLIVGDDLFLAVSFAILGAAFACTVIHEDFEP